MAGRNPSLDGRKALAGAQGLVAEGLSIAAAAGVPIPATLGRWGRIAWREAVATLAPKQNLASIDLRALEMACRQYEIWATAEREIDVKERASAGSGEYVTTPNGHRQMSAERITANRAMREYMRIMPLFGATPVGRIRTSGTAQGDLFDFIGMDSAARDEPAPAIDPTDPYAPLSRHLQ